MVQPITKILSKQTTKGLRRKRSVTLPKKFSFNKKNIFKNTQRDRTLRSRSREIKKKATESVFDMVQMTNLASKDFKKLLLICSKNQRKQCLSKQKKV